jgi:hypothetical protein
MAIDPLSIATAAGISALSPVVAKGIGSLFGLDEPSEEEQRASRLRQEALDRLTAQAEGRTASPAQLAALAQQQRTQQALQSLAQRGTVQQRAGNVRAAMQAAPEVMAQQGAVAAQTRAAEMESARNALAQMQMASAAQEAAAGRANREYMQRLIGAGVSGGASAAASGMLQGAEPEAPKKPTWGERMGELEAQSGKSLQAPMLRPQAQAPAAAAPASGVGAEVTNTGPTVGPNMYTMAPAMSEQLFKQTTEAGVDLGKPGMAQLYFGGAGGVKNAGMKQPEFAPSLPTLNLGGAAGVRTKNLFKLGRGY